MTWIERISSDHVVLQTLREIDLSWIQIDAEGIKNLSEILKSNQVNKFYDDVWRILSDLCELDAEKN